MKESFRQSPHLNKSAKMQDYEIYSLTARGKNELRGSATKLSSTQIELLVRIDGALTFAQIRASMPGVSVEAFPLIFKGLLDRRLLSLVPVDPFAEQFQSQLNKLALSVATDEADSGALSLKRSGYYVGIARKRDPLRLLEKGRVLTAIVVEDDPLLAKFIQSYLSFDGFQVRVAANRAEVVSELRKLPIPDVILLDVMLPDADGFDILLRLRQHPVLKDVGVIMLTGKASREAVIKGLACGADGYITKPFEADALMRAVRTVVGLPEDLTGSNFRDPWVNRDSLP